MSEHAHHWMPCTSSLLVTCSSACRTLCRDGLNVVAVLKAMGLESDQEALQLAGCDGASASLLVPTLQDCKALSVFTQRQALEYLGELQVYGCAFLTLGPCWACPEYLCELTAVCCLSGFGGSRCGGCAAWLSVRPRTCACQMVSRLLVGIVLQGLGVHVSSSWSDSS